MPGTESVEAGRLIIDGGKLENDGSVTINDTLTFVATGTKKPQFLNKGTVVNSGVVQIIKEFDPANGWSFMSFPFDVDKVINYETGLPAVIGGLGDANADVYILVYDGYNRDRLTSGDPNYVVNGVYWANFDPKDLNKCTGYLMVTPVKRRIAFISANGETQMFSSAGQITVSKYNTNPDNIHHSWNLIGTPFTSAFNLMYASQSHAPYYLFDGFTYKVAMYDDEDVEAYPFGSFFVQAYGPDNTISYTSEGRMLKAANAKSTDEISLILENANFSDKARIRIQEDASSGYDLGKDAVKFMSPKKEVPQLYSKSLGYNLSVSALPVGTAKVDLGMYIGEKGKYSIRLTDVQKSAAFDQVILVDNETGEQTDLLASEEGYSFESSTTGTSKRFSVLLIAEGATAVGTAQGGTIIIQAIGDKAYISGLEGAATVTVYDVAGKLTQRFTNVNNGDALTLNNTGVAIIEVNTATQTAKAKVSVKK